MTRGVRRSPPRNSPYETSKMSWMHKKKDPEAEAKYPEDSPDVTRPASPDGSDVSSAAAEDAPNSAMVASLRRAKKGKTTRSPTRSPLKGNGKPLLFWEAAEFRQLVDRVRSSTARRYGRAKKKASLLADVVSKGARPLGRNSTFEEKLSHPRASYIKEAYDNFVGEIVEQGPRASDAVGVQIERFLAAARAAMQANMLWEDESRDEFEEEMEHLRSLLFDTIYEHVRPLINDEDSDRILSRRINILRRFVTPAHLEVPMPERRYCDNDFKEATEALLRIHTMRSPNEKIACITDASRALCTMLQKASGTEPGADDLLPAMILSVIRTNPPWMSSELTFIETFGDEEVLVGEGAYMFTQLYSAKEFLERISDPSSLGMSAQQFYEGVASAEDDGALWEEHVEIKEEDKLSGRDYRKQWAELNGKPVPESPAAAMAEAAKKELFAEDADETHWYVIAPWDATSDKELWLDVGELIDVTHVEDSGWAYGVKIGGDDRSDVGNLEPTNEDENEAGWFPLYCVEKQKEGDIVHAEINMPVAVAALSTPPAPEPAATPDLIDVTSAKEDMASNATHSASTASMGDATTATDSTYSSLTLDTPLQGDDLLSATGTFDEFSGTTPTPKAPDFGPAGFGPAGPSLLDTDNPAFPPTPTLPGGADASFVLPTTPPAATTTPPAPSAPRMSDSSVLSGTTPTPKAPGGADASFVLPTTPPPTTTPPAPSAPCMPASSFQIDPLSLMEPPADLVNLRPPVPPHIEANSGPARGARFGPQSPTVVLASPVVEAAPEDVFAGLDEEEEKDDHLFDDLLALDPIAVSRPGLRRPPRTEEALTPTVPGMAAAFPRTAPAPAPPVARSQPAAPVNAPTTPHDVAFAWDMEVNPEAEAEYTPAEAEYATEEAEYATEEAPYATEEAPYATEEAPYATEEYPEEYTEEHAAEYPAEEYPAEYNAEEYNSNVTESVAQPEYNYDNDYTPAQEELEPTVSTTDGLGNLTLTLNRSPG